MARPLFSPPPQVLVAPPTLRKPVCVFVSLFLSLLPFSSCPSMFTVFFPLRSKDDDFEGAMMRTLADELRGVTEERNYSSSFSPPPKYRREHLPFFFPI